MVNKTNASGAFRGASQYIFGRGHYLRGLALVRDIPVSKQFRSSIMQSSYETSTDTNRVVALYADSALSFDLSKTATFADLADRVDRLGEQHIGTPTAIYMKFSMTFEPVTQHVGNLT